MIYSRYRRFVWFEVEHADLAITFHDRTAQTPTTAISAYSNDLVHSIYQQQLSHFSGADFTIQVK